MFPLRLKGIRAGPVAAVAPGEAGPPRASPRHLCTQRLRLPHKYSKFLIKTYDCVNSAAWAPNLEKTFHRPPCLSHVGQAGLATVPPAPGRQATGWARWLSRASAWQYVAADVRGPWAHRQPAAAGSDPGFQRWPPALPLAQESWEGWLLSRSKPRPQLHPPNLFPGGSFCSGLGRVSSAHPRPLAGCGGPGRAVNAGTWGGSQGGAATGARSTGERKAAPQGGGRTPLSAGVDRQTRVEEETRRNPGSRKIPP